MAFQDESYPSTPTPVSPLATSIASIPSKPSSLSLQDRRKNWRFGTICATTESKDQYGASSVPIYQTATFKGLNGEYDYTRSGNPTRTALETQLARLYTCTRAFAVSTGMTALDIILRLISPGDIILAGTDIYGGTDRLLTFMKTNGGAEVQHLDLDVEEKLAEVLATGGHKIKMVLVESPTNPLLKIANLRKISDMVHAASPDALVVVDNTMMSPYLQRPLNLGADIVYDSGTKYLSGHHDVMAGIIAVERDEVAKRVAFLINSTGTGLAPQDCFLLLRGLKTLSIRMDRQSSTAFLVAQYLHTLGFHVNFPGLASHPDRDVHYSQADGAGAVLSFTTGDIGASERIVGGTRLWGISVSFGCVNSLISMPCVMSHASISAEKRAERGLPENLIRLCVGIEDPRDLIDDLEHSLIESGAIYQRFDIDSTPNTPTTGEPTPDIYVTNPEQWIVERAQKFVRSGLGQEKERTASPVEGLIDSVKTKLGFSGPEGKEGDVSDVSKEEEQDILVSAPGKVILFGEHAVVHGVTAIAAAVNLRCFAHLFKRPDHKLALDLPDINLIREWQVDSLPWDKFTAVPLEDGNSPAELDPDSLAAVERFLTNDGLDHTAHAGALAIIYLYMVMGNHKERRGASYCARSALPIGAGLGSSASYASCIAAAFLKLFNRIEVSNTAPGEIADAPYPGHQGISRSQATLINGWAFLAEKVIHGNPSGIDNAVAVNGGALGFTRAMEGRPGGMTSLQGFKSIRFLLTDTKVPRSTKILVAGVAAKMQADPEDGKRVMAAIQAISDKATTLLTSTTVPREELLSGLAALIDENHEHLAHLGVSHPTLELIRSKTRSSPYHLSTKLTGAGGGGCAVTLIPDDMPESRVQDLVQSLHDDGFQSYLTAVGGSGLGVLQSSVRAVTVDAPGAGESSHIPLRKAFQEIDASRLELWAEQTGEWIFT